MLRISAPALAAHALLLVGVWLAAPTLDALEGGWLIALVVIGMIVPWSGQRMARRMENAYIDREIDADRFAGEITGRPDAMLRALNECARLEDGELELTTEVQLRIAALRGGDRAAEDSGAAFERP